MDTTSAAVTIITRKTAKVVDAEKTSTTHGIYPSAVKNSKRKTNTASRAAVRLIFRENVSSKTYAGKMRDTKTLTATEQKSAPAMVPKG